MSLTRRDALASIAGALSAAALYRSGQAASAQTGSLTLREIAVPIDHEASRGERFALRYALRTPFDPRRPTVIFLSDGQQFFVNETAFGPSVDRLFDDRFNVVGVFGRGSIAEVQQRVGAGADVNWPDAYRLLRARQWIGDVEAVRRDLLGANGKVLLYGASGGATMTHQYLTAYGNRVARALTLAAVDPYLVAALGLESDHFWDEISPADRAALSGVLRANPAERDRIVHVFQRQNFFVDRGQLAERRHELIASLASGKRDLLEKLVLEYQVAAINDLIASPLGPAVAVREYELVAPLVGRYDFAASARLYPDHELEMRLSAPLIRAAREGRIALPAWDHRALHAVTAPAILLAGRWDHTCDYRSQIALAAHYPNGRLHILDDDHTVHRLRESGKQKTVTIGLLSPDDSAEYASAVRTLDPLEWVEDGPLSAG